MSFGLRVNRTLGGAAQGAAIGGAIPGLGTAIGGAIGGGLGLLSGLFGEESSIEYQMKLMEKAWEYEKEGMGMQYQYGQEAAKAAQQRNMEMWNQTNYGAQRQHMEDAGLSVGLMYGGGGQGAVAQGGQATQPSGKLHFQVEEPGYVMGLIAITPMVDYSQGNDFDLNLFTMDDLHKPALDGIGYQDLMNEQRAWWTAEQLGTSIS